MTNSRRIVLGAAAAGAVAGFACVQAWRGDLIGVAIDLIGLVIVYASIADDICRRRVEAATCSCATPYCSCEQNAHQSCAPTADCTYCNAAGDIAAAYLSHRASIDEAQLGEGGGGHDAPH